LVLDGGEEDGGDEREKYGTEVRGWWRKRGEKEGVDGG
jgi:hypothetical protein